MGVKITELDFFDGAASGQQRSALMRMKPENVMISHATYNNVPWDNDFQGRNEYTLFVDSGGFSHMKAGTGEFQSSDKAYLDYLETHEPAFWALRDYPCEPELLADLGRTVEEQQRRTTDHASKLLNAAEDRSLSGQPVPVVQGWEPDDYLQHIDTLRDRGILKNAGRVGIGSICRRDPRGVAKIVLTVREELPSSFSLHGFGVDKGVLRYREVVDALASADSCAYDFETAHYDRPGDRHSYRDSAFSWLGWRSSLKRQIGTLSIEDEQVREDISVACRGCENPRMRAAMVTLDRLREDFSKFRTKEILERAELNESQSRTVRRALQDLEAEGWVDHQPRSPWWFPGPLAETELAG